MTAAVPEPVTDLAVEKPAVEELPASTVTVYPDGPLVVRGDFQVRTLDGEQLASGRTVALCRCGRSAVKPFCDGSHKLRRVVDARSRRSSRHG